MKKLHFLLAVLLVVAFISDTTAENLPTLPDYSDESSWVILNGNSDKNTEFDVFYIYPTLVSDKNCPITDWKKPENFKKTSEFVKFQTGIFEGKARIFAPFTRHCEYKRIANLIRKPNAQRSLLLLKPALLDSIMAFKEYYRKYNNGRPFILLGHSQGAICLYNVIKYCNEICKPNGFVAAYLIGYPKMTHQMVEKDFAERGITVAQNATDTSVIVSWNTEASDAGLNPFTIENGVCINPINWQTDSTQADASENLGSIFYNYKEPDPDKQITETPNLCGAYVSLERGSLVTDLPSNSYYDARGMFGKGVLHMNDINLFAKNLVKNCVERVKSSF